VLGSPDISNTKYDAEEKLNDPHDLVKDGSLTLFFYGKTFVPMKMVDFLLDMLPLGYLITPLSHKKDSTIWRYDEYTGTYGPHGITWINKTMQDLLGEETKTARQNEVVNQLRTKTTDWDDEFNHENPDFVMLMNGAFSLSEKKLYSYSPTYKAKSRLPIYYDPEAKCPEIDSFLSQVFHQDDIPVIEEWMAYHLEKGYPFAKILFLIGDGANGKSTFLNLLEAMLGEENVSKKTLFELNADNFAAAKLYGKLGNISPDVSEDEIKYSGKLKALTGNETIDAREIYQSSFKFKNQAKLSCAANKPPKTPDVTTAWFRRLLFIICDRTFSPEEADPNILQKLTTREELSGFFNVMLIARERLLSNGNFSREETPDQVQEKYDLMSDPITAFVEDCVIHKAGASFEKDAFYLAFRTYCRKRGFTPCMKGELTKELNTRYGKSISVSTPRVKGKRVPTWNGIGLDLETREKWVSGKGGTSGDTLIPFIQKKDKEGVIDTPTTLSTPTSEDFDVEEWDDPDYKEEEDE